MVSKSLLVVGYFYMFCYGLLLIGNGVVGVCSNRNSDDASPFLAIELPAAPSSSLDSGSGFSNSKKTLFPQGGFEHEHDGFKVQPTVMLNLKHQSSGKSKRPEESVMESTAKDLKRIQTLHRRIVEKRRKQNSISRISRDDIRPAESANFAPAPSSESGFSGQLMATLKSGLSLGSGEYLMDVFVGTPPKHFSLILDTGSDLNWIQCKPCYDCFQQKGPYYDPMQSNSYRNVACKDPRCRLVSSPDPPQPCKAETQTCPYYYWYGDSSNTTGDFALETFTVNLTAKSGISRFWNVKNVMFGCGHWNRGLFHGAAGVLGLGRGPLSFASQLRSLYGDSFSYCLLSRNSNMSSKLVFGEDKELRSHPDLNFTTLVAGKENPVSTFYYVQIKSVVVGGEKLNIPEEMWNVSADGAGGTIVDSGTTLSYFADPAYKIIKEAFVEKVKGYHVVKDFPIMDPCYNVSGVGVDELDLPSFSFVFADGAVWNFPVENYFIKLEPENVVCLAILGTPRSALSIIGNYQQQNFHILYDTKRSRLGFVLTNCADI
ncbi:Aspartyl protease family protein 2 [Sesamum alatum]|uniref:Aspartyl protease family protein 2 n=1 Tax=Sesamum alatum TaxID=300844 RepID=A0AAE1YFQ4_9LAMI|nr:Aspartyl protease family protein 2 [Sesamum alatum]